MKIDYYYPELGLWVTLWAEKPGRFAARWWLEAGAYAGQSIPFNEKQKLKEDIRLAVTGVLPPADAAALAADPAKDAGPASMPEGDDGFIGE